MLMEKYYANFRVIFVEDQTFRQNVLFMRDLSANLLAVNIIVKTRRSLI